MAGKKLRELYALIEGIETAMFTTRRRDGHLVSRPMATQAKAPGADLWFVTMEEFAKLGEIEADPHVNLSYYKDRTREWVSVSGTAHATRNRAKIRLLWRPDWKIWFPPSGDPRDGTPDDPRMVLVGVKAHSATFMTSDRPGVLAILEIVKGFVTGSQPHLGTVKELKPAELRGRRGGRPRGRSPARSSSRRAR
jgi:general stress protein 26